MRIICPPRLDEARLHHQPAYDSPAGALWGAFLFRPEGLLVISSGPAGTNATAAGWEHVSVSGDGVIPTWEQMCWVKQLFWADDETVVQLHPANEHYININPNVLHLWKGPVEHPLPPKEFV